MRAALAALAALVCAACTSAAPAPLMMERAEPEASGWQRGARAPRVAMISMQIMVRQQRLEVLAQEVLSRASPSSPGFSKPWLTNEEVHAMVAPDPRHIAAVRDWLQQSALAVSEGACARTFTRLPLLCLREL